jgi:DNA repair protein RecN (Recombination protein N)
VTHQPQVAALGHHHFQVSKETRAGNTTTGIRPLSAKERIDEIARMLGGIDITPQTRSHAKEMLERSA